MNTKQAIKETWKKIKETLIKIWNYLGETELAHQASEKQQQSKQKQNNGGYEVEDDEIDWFNVTKI